MTASREARGIIDWLFRSGVDFIVTSRFPATPGVHAPRSYHYAAGTDGDSLAVDFVGPSLQRIYNAFVPIRGSLAELLGPGDPGHDDHVHVAVRRGMFLVPFPRQEDILIPENRKLLTAFAFQDGYVIVATDGAVYCFGCEYKGGLRWDGTNWVV